MWKTFLLRPFCWPAVHSNIKYQIFSEKGTRLWHYELHFPYLLPCSRSRIMSKGRSSNYHYVSCGSFVLGTLLLHTSPNYNVFGRQFVGDFTTCCLTRNMLLWTEMLIPRSTNFARKTLACDILNYISNICFHSLFDNDVNRSFFQASLWFIIWVAVVSFSEHTCNLLLPTTMSTP